MFSQFPLAWIVGFGISSCLPCQNTRCSAYQLVFAQKSNNNLLPWPANWDDTKSQTSQSQIPLIGFLPLEFWLIYFVKTPAHFWEFKMFHEQIRSLNKCFDPRAQKSIKHDAQPHRSAKHSECFCVPNPLQPIFWKVVGLRSISGLNSSQNSIVFRMWSRQYWSEFHSKELGIFPAFGRGAFAFCALPVLAISLWR